MANRGCCEAVNGVNVIFFLLSIKIYYFSIRKNIFFAKFFHPRPLKWSPTTFYYCLYLPTPFCGCPMQLGGLQCKSEAAWRLPYYKMVCSIPLVILKTPHTPGCKKIAVSKRFGHWNFSVGLSKRMVLAWLIISHGLKLAILKS